MDNHFGLLKGTGAEIAFYLMFLCDGIVKLQFLLF